MQLIILGAGGHGKVIADIVQSEGKEVKGFVDDTRTGTVFNLPILGKIEDLSKLKQEGVTHFIAGVGNNDVRQKLYEKALTIGLEPYTAIHPSATISPSSKIGKGTVIMAGAVINPDTVIGNNVVINTCCSVDHDNIIKDHVQLTPRVVTGGTVTVGERTYVGIGATILNNITIGPDTLIGGGATVTKDIPNNVVAVGIPAKVIKEK